LIGSSQFNEGVVEDLYQLGLVFLELILSSFCDDNKGAIIARSYMSINERRSQRDADSEYDADADDVDVEDKLLEIMDSPMRLFVGKKGEINQSPLSHQEIQTLYETLCRSDFLRLRRFIRYVH